MQFNRPEKTFKENPQLAERNIHENYGNILHIIIISNEFSEHQWKECINLGVYIYYNRPESKDPGMIKWLKFFRGE